MPCGVEQARGPGAGAAPGSQVVVEAVVVGRSREQLAAVAATAEAGAVAVRIGLHRDRLAPLAAARVERRVEVDQPEAAPAPAAASARGCRPAGSGRPRLVA